MSAVGAGGGAGATDDDDRPTWPPSFSSTAPLRSPAVQPLSVEAPSSTGRPGPLARLAAWARPRRGGGAAFTRLDEGGGSGPSSSTSSSSALSPEDTASLPARLLFTFVDGLVRAGLAKPLETDDLWPVSRRDAARTVSARFEAALAASAAASPDGRPSLAAAAWAVHGRLFAAVGVLKLVHDVLLFAGPYILERLLHHLSSPGKPSAAVGLALACALAGTAALETLTINSYFHALFRIGAHLKVALANNLFLSALSLSISARDGRGAGAVATLLSNDAAKLWGLPQYLHMLWSAPFQVLVALALLVRILGWLPSAVGLAATVAFIPLTTAVNKKLAVLRKEVMGATDARVRAAAEVVGGVRAVKLMAWEPPYLARIGRARAAEVAAVRRMALFGVLNSVVFGGAPVIIALAAFLTFAARGGALTPAAAFPALALFNLLRFPVLMGPRVLNDTVAARVALDRLQGFLKAETVAARRAAPAASPPSDAVVVSPGAAFAWSRVPPTPGAPPPAPTLRFPAGLRVRAGDLVVVVGDVGSGKSSLLHALLGEMVSATGGASSVSLAGSVAYAAQDPWIRNQTVRANITWDDWPLEDGTDGTAGGEKSGGRVFDGAKEKNKGEEWYGSVLDACALRPDLASWPAGDATEIGEKGVTLSGGQRARVALARACFAAADIYLLDDPLSAVDAHVGAHLWSSCLTGLLAGRTRVLVTHQVQYAAAAATDVVVVVRGGAVVAAGPPGSVDLGGLSPPAPPTPASSSASSGPPTPPPAAPPRRPDGSAGPPVVEEEDGGGGGGGGIAGTPAEAEFVGETAVVEGGGGAEAVDGPPPLPRVVPPPLPANPPGTAIVRTDGGAGVEIVPASPFVELSLEDDDGGGGSAAAPWPATLPTSAPARTASAPLPPAPASASLAPLTSMPPPPPSAAGRVVKAEERAVGRVHRSVYRVYLAAWGGLSSPRWVGACLPRRPPPAVVGAGGGEGEAAATATATATPTLLSGPPPRPTLPLPALVVAIAGAERGLQVAQNLFLAAWADRTARALSSSGGGSGSIPGPATFIAVYASLGVASLVAQVARAVATVEGSLAAAVALHDRLLARVIRLPMAFFDSQPSGRLLNRFSKDTEALDVTLGGTVQSALTCAASSLFAVLVVVGTTPASALALIPLAWAYARVQTSFISASREIKRLDSITASPVFGGFSEVLAGLTTIRAFGLAGRAAAAQRSRLDAATRTFWPMMCLNRWLSVRLELLGIAVVFCATVSAGVLLPTSSGVAGLAITSALSLTGLLAWMVRQVTELEVAMNCVERVDEYSRAPPEAPAVNPACRPPPGWPSRGALAVRGLVVRYRPGLDPALRGVSFDVPGGSRLGVAGRTGSGKTSLMMALFRIIEPEAGSVTLDGIDTARLGLADLRGRGLGIVPQDAVLFSGTIRSNVDPFDTVRASPGGGGDAALWRALDAAGLGPAVRAMGGGEGGEEGGSGLDARVAEGGANLSHGQRQLLCMARALLRSPRVLVLDEATSSVDPATDAAIQATIRSAFAGSTLLIIAHRLRTISDADAVLVLEAGRVAEHGRPSDLLATPGSAFRAMVEEAARQGGGGGRGGKGGSVDLEVRPASAADLLGAAGE